MGKRTASAIGKRNRQRGQEGEREVCSILADALGRPVKRALGQERDRGTDIVSLPPFSIEVKRRKRIANLYEWMMQARNPDKSDPFGWRDVPAVALRGDGEDWLIVIGLDTFIKLAREEISK
jgi:hypothetical protein